MKTIMLSVASASVLFTGLASADTQVTGTVRAIYTNRAWNGIFVKLNVPQIFEPGTSCANDAAYIPIDDPLAKASLGVLLSAKATGETVTIYTNGCVAAPLGVQPILERIDYGPP